MIGRLCVISQPRYLPVISYLQRLAFADVFLLYDTVKRQYAGWENRNKLLLPNPKWLTIPISSSRMEIIMRTEIRDSAWVRQHKQTILHNYRKHPHFNEAWVEKYYDGIEDMMEKGNRLFVDVIEKTLLNLGNMLGFKPKIVRVSSIENDLTRKAKGPDKLRELCKAIKADIYVSGENGRVYGVEEAFAGSGITVRYHASRGFKYAQPGQETFVPYMGFFDVLFCVGLERLAEEVLKPPVLEK